MLHHGSDVWTDMANDVIDYIESKGTPGVQRLNWEEFDMLLSSYLHKISDKKDEL